ncbi:MAG: hypothetical protein ACYC6B_07350 [Thermoleophilia bacterium]
MPKPAYLIITIACLITSIYLWFSAYHGYAGLMLAIGLAAAINLKK